MCPCSSAVREVCGEAWRSMPELSELIQTSNALLFTCIPKCLPLNRYQPSLARKRSAKGSEMESVGASERKVKAWIHWKQYFKGSTISNVIATYRQKKVEYSKVLKFIIYCNNIIYCTVCSFGHLSHVDLRTASLLPSSGMFRPHRSH